MFIVIFRNMLAEKRWEFSTMKIYASSTYLKI